jgi:hypothetical protein
MEEEEKGLQRREKGWKEKRDRESRWLLVGQFVRSSGDRW